MTSGQDDALRELVALLAAVVGDDGERLSPPAWSVVPPTDEVTGAVPLGVWSVRSSQPVPL